MASATTPQLQALLRWSEHLPDRHLDDAAGDQLARLSTDPFGAAAVQSLAMAALTLAHVINLWEIVALAAMQGLINAFDMPARQSFLVQMVEDRNDLSNAIAINSSMVNAARLIGPAIAGLVIGAAGEGWCFLIDGVSYFAVIASLLMMRIKPLHIPPTASSVIEQMREGWDYVRTFRPIRTILLLFSLLCLMGYPFAVLLPVFVGEVLHGNATTLGWPVRLCRHFPLRSASRSLALPACFRSQPRCWEAHCFSSAYRVRCGYRLHR